MNPFLCDILVLNSAYRKWNKISTIATLTRAGQYHSVQEGVCIGQYESSLKHYIVDEGR